MKTHRSSSSVSLLSLVFSLSFFAEFNHALAKLDLLRPRPIHRISVDPRTGGGQTFFDLALESYRRGGSFDPSKVFGVYIGRCYYADSPMRPVASLVVISQEDAALHGPGTNRYSRLVPLVDRDSAPDRYDNLQVKDLLPITKLASEFGEELALPVESRRETYVVGLRTPDEDSRLYRFRRADVEGHGSELHLRLECAEDQVCLSANPSLGRQTVLAFEGQSIAQCRYFKRLDPRAPASVPSKQVKVPSNTKAAAAN
jgi:hypothetical protein